MKKLILAIAFMSSFAAVQAQTELKINPLGLLFLSPDLSAEFAVSEDIGIEPTVGISFLKLKVEEESLKSTGLSYGVQGKYYFNPDKGIDKFYAGIYLRGGNSTFTSSTAGDNDKLTQNKLGIGLALGYKWVSKKNIVFELGGGLGRKLFNKFNVESGSTNLSNVPILNFDGFFRFSVGYRFGGDGGGSSRRK
jgi:hypothetical protein